MRVVLLAMLCAGGLSTAVLGAGAWVPDGPEGGEFRLLAASPADSALLYATVGPTNAPLYGFYVSPTLARSADGGESWQRLNAFRGQEVRQLLVDPAEARVVYAVVYREPGRNELWRSADRGDTWSRIFAAAEDYSPLTAGLVAAPGRSAGVVLVSEHNTGRTMRSTDGGKTFADVTPARRRSFDEIVGDPSGSGRVLALGDVLYRSLDFGRTWLGDAEGVPLANHLVVAPSDPLRWYVIGNEGVYASKNGGVTWRMVNALWPADALAVDAEDANRVVAANFYGVFLSANGGSTFRKAQRGVPPRFVYASPYWIVRGIVTQPGRIVLGTATGLYVSTNAGLGYRPAALRGLHADLATQVRFDPFDAWHAVVAALNGVSETRDAGRSWLPFAPALHALHIGDLHFDAAGEVWAVVFDRNNAQRLLRSRDGGATWEQRSGSHDTFFGALAVLGSGTLLSSWAGRSVDGGRHWKQVHYPFPIGDRNRCDASIDRFVVEPRHAQRVVAIGGVFCIHGGRSPASVASDDGGVTWRLLAYGGPAAFDPEDDQRLLLGAGGRVFETLDGGVTARELRDFGSPVVDILALAGDELLVATRDYLDLSRSTVWRSADGGATWIRWGGGLATGSPGLFYLDPRAPRRVIVTPDSGGIYRRSLD